MKKNREQLIKDVTNEALKSKFSTEVGQKARVERSTVQSEQFDQLREVLRDVGQNIQDTGSAPKGMDYLGSLSVHIYVSTVLRTAAFVTLSATEKLPFELAEAGLHELRGTTLVDYGRRRQKKRSGF